MKLGRTAVGHDSDHIGVGHLMNGGKASRIFFVILVGSSARLAVSVQINTIGWIILACYRIAHGLAGNILYGQPGLEEQGKIDDAEN